MRVGDYISRTDGSWPSVLYSSPPERIACLSVCLSVCCTLTTFTRLSHQHTVPLLYFSFLFLFDCLLGFYLCAALCGHDEGEIPFWWIFIPMQEGK